MSKRSRRKITQAHSTVIEPAELAVKVAGKAPEVNRISLGYIRAGLRSAPRRIKVTELETGALRVMVRGGSSVQELMVYSEDPGRTKERLEKAYT